MPVKCPHCGIQSEGKPVPPSLIKEPGGRRIAVIGETPGEKESTTGIPFMGPGGKLLRATLRAVGQNDEEVFFTNVCCCHPQGDETPSPEQIAQARPRLFRELEAFNPDIVIPVGNFATAAVLGMDDCKITQMRGLLHRALIADGRDIQVLPTIHPAAILRDPSGFRDFRADLAKAVSLPAPFQAPTCIVAGSSAEARALIDCHLSAEPFSKLIPYPDPYKPITIDIETTGFSPEKNRILSLGFSPSRDLSIILPYEVVDEPVMKMLRKMGTEEQYSWIGHNAVSFDEPFLWYNAGLRIDIQWDTLLLHYLVDERGGKQALDEVARDMFMIPNWKAKFKQYILGDGATYADAPEDKLYEYQAMDTAVTHAIWEELTPAFLKNPKLLQVYREVYLPCGKILAEVERNGIQMDLDQAMRVKVMWEAKLEDYFDRIRKITGRPDLNPRSSKQLAEYFFDELELPEGLVNKKKPRSVDKHVLSKLGIRENVEEVCTLLTDAKSLSTNLSTYVKGSMKKVGEDGRLRPHFLLHGTPTGRISCRNPNLQNVTKHNPEMAAPIRSMFVSRPGWILVEMDHSQLEYRWAAELSKDPGFLAAFNSGFDFHQATAAIIFGIPVEEVTKEQRFEAKFFNFGVLYGRGWESIAKALGWSRIKAQRFIKDYWNKFPVLYAWVEQTKAFAAKNGYVETFFGNRRRWPLRVDSNKNEIEREAVNTCCQGSASHLCLLGMEEIQRTLANPKHLVVEFPIHDAIVFEMLEEASPDLIPQCAYIMENPHFEHTVPFKVDTVIGTRWNLMEDWFPA